MAILYQCFERSLKGADKFHINTYIHKHKSQYVFVHTRTYVHAYVCILLSVAYLLKGSRDEDATVAEDDDSGLMLMCFFSAKNSS